jgi:glucoamylase
MEPALVHWSFDNWQNSHDSNSSESGWNLQHVDLPTEILAPGRQIIFTFYWKNTDRWEGRDYQVAVE